jgi:hypothetical protein
MRTNPKPIWEEKYHKEGLNSASKDTFNVLLQIQKKFGSDYLTFFRSLQGMYLQVGDTKYNTEISTTIKAIQNVVRQIGTLRGAQGRLANAQEIDSLLQSLDVIQEKYEFFSQNVSTDARLEVFLQRIQERTGLSLDQMKQVHAQVKERMVKRMGGKESTIPEKFFDMRKKLRDVSPDLYDFGKAFGTQALNGLLGPFAGLGSFAIRGITGIARKLGERAATKKEGKFREALLTKEEYTPENVYKTYEDLKLKGPTLQSVFNKVWGTPESFVSPSETPRPSKEHVRKTLKEKVEPHLTGTKSEHAYLKSGIVGSSALVFVSALKKFFEKEAYTTKWTKEVLENLKIIAKKKQVAAGGGGSLLGNLGKVALSALPIVAGIVGTGMGAWDAFQGVRKTKEWFGTEKPHLGQKVASSIGGFLGGTGKGIGEKGSTWGGVAKNTLWNTAKGASIGAGIGSFLGPGGTLLGAGIGAGAGAIGGLLGGRRLAQGAQALWRVTPIGLAQEMFQGARDGGLGGLGKNLLSALTLGAVKKYQKPESVPPPRKLEEIKQPETKTSSDGTKETIEKLQKTIEDLSSALSKAQQQSNQQSVHTRRTFNDDVYNTRDPLLESLNSGNLGLEE